MQALFLGKDKVCFLERCPHFRGVLRKREEKEEEEEEEKEEEEEERREMSGDNDNLPEIVDSVAKGPLGCNVARMMWVHVDLAERENSNTVEPLSDLDTDGMKSTKVQTLGKLRMRGTAN